jgi:hypothetical protein
LFELIHCGGILIDEQLPLIFEFRQAAAVSSKTNMPNRDSDAPGDIEQFIERTGLH